MKKIISFILAFIFTTALGVSALASPAMTETSQTPSSVQETDKSPDKKMRERREQIKKKHDDMREKFKALEADEKNNIYKINDEILKLQMSLLDEYASVGILTKEEAESAKKSVTDLNEQNKKDGVMPGTHLKKAK